MYDVAIAYKEGNIVERDNAESFRWYLNAAESGVVPAMYSVGLRYCQGEIVPQDFNKALFWLNKCQQNGYNDDNGDLSKWIKQINEELSSDHENIRSQTRFKIMVFLFLAILTIFSIYLFKAHNVTSKYISADTQPLAYKERLTAPPVNALSGCCQSNGNLSLSDK